MARLPQISGGQGNLTSPNQAYQGAHESQRYLRLSGMNYDCDRGMILRFCRVRFLTAQLLKDQGLNEISLDQAIKENLEKRVIRCGLINERKEE